MFKEPESSSSLFYVTYIIMYMLCCVLANTMNRTCTYCIWNVCFNSNVFVNISLHGITHFQLTAKIDPIGWHISSDTVKWNTKLNESQMGSFVSITFVCELKMSERNKLKPVALALLRTHYTIYVIQCTLYTQWNHM